jgi:RNA polymerase sigma-70 factor (ECF subfamily)
VSVVDEPVDAGRDYVHAASAPDFDSFFRREFRPMVALAAAVAGSAEHAEDIAQEALVRARRHWDRVVAYDKPGTWLRRVTINIALSNRRRIALEAKTRLAWFDHREEPAGPDSLDPALVGALGLLSPQQRAAVSLHYLEDRSTAEIAELLGCAEATARVHLHRGRQALARTLGATR